MFLRILTSMFCTFLLASTVHAGNISKVQRRTPQQPSIKVLVAENSEGVILEVKGSYNIFDPHDKSRLGTRFTGKRNFLQPLQGGLKWGEEFPGTYQLAIIPDTNTITTIVDGIEYRGNLFVYDVGGKLSIVNEVGVEDYLKSILATRFKERIAPEALASIVIAERTNALYTVNESTNPYWHVRASDVGYEGHAITGRANGVDEAVAATRHMVMHHGGAVFPVATHGLHATAQAMANSGNHAAEILAREYPNTSIQICSK